MEEKKIKISEAKLMKGNEALAEAAICADIDAYFGYPITPQSEVLEYLEREIPKRHGLVLQAESEIASINMIYGAAGAGARVMTSSSGPGISLMQEGLSYIASAQLPCLGCECCSWWSWSWYNSTISGRLFSGSKRRRTRRLSFNSFSSCFSSGNG